MDAATRFFDPFGREILAAGQPPPRPPSTLPPIPRLPPTWMGERLDLDAALSSLH